MGETYLLDTSACSKYIQGLLNDQATEFMNTVVETSSVLSIIARIELLSWITGNKELDEDIRQFISESNVVDLTESIILQMVRLRRHYKSIKLPDAIIAATAMVNDWTLLSTNDSDFTKISGLRYRSLN
ncbi:type II toxin-antitoxin system VapC family toxin [Spirosoma gilvum]